MFSSNERRAIGQKRVRVDFSKTGWRQFEKLNRKLGTRYLSAFILKHELMLYLTEHEASGYHLDTDCQEIHYEDGVYLLLRRSQGVWYITDVFRADSKIAAVPVYFWQRIKHGVNYVLCKVLIGWMKLPRKAVPIA